MEHSNFFSWISGAISTDRPQSTHRRRWYERVLDLKIWDFQFHSERQINGMLRSMYGKKSDQSAAAVESIGKNVADVEAGDIDQHLVPDAAKDA